jgi:hypothetical protein
MVTFDTMLWDDHEGKVLEITLFGFIFQVAIGRRVRD